MILTFFVMYSFLGFHDRYNSLIKHISLYMYSSINASVIWLSNSLISQYEVISYTTASLVAFSDLNWCTLTKSSCLNLSVYIKQVNHARAKIFWIVRYCLLIEKLKRSWKNQNLKYFVSGPSYLLIYFYSGEWWSNRIRDDWSTDMSL